MFDADSTVQKVFYLISSTIPSQKERPGCCNTHLRQILTAKLLEFKKKSAMSGVKVEKVLKPYSNISDHFAIC